MKCTCICIRCIKRDCKCSCTCGVHDEFCVCTCYGIPTKRKKYKIKKPKVCNIIIKKMEV